MWPPGWSSGTPWTPGTSSPELAQQREHGPGRRRALIGGDRRLDVPRRPVAERAHRDPLMVDDHVERVPEHHARAGGDLDLGLDGLIAAAGEHHPRPAAGQPGAAPAASPPRRAGRALTWQPPPGRAAFVRPDPRRAREVVEPVRGPGGEPVA